MYVVPGNARCGAHIARAAHAAALFPVAETSYGCEFEKAFGILYGLSAIGQVVFKLLSGPTADWADDSSVSAMKAVVVAQLAMQLLLFCVSWRSLFSVIAISLVLGATTLMAQNLILKIAKMHLEREPGVHDQTAAINALQTWGVFGSTFLVAIATGSAYWYGEHGGGSWDAVKWLIYAVSLSFTVLTGLFVHMLPGDFISSRPTTASMRRERQALARRRGNEVALLDGVAGEPGADAPPTNAALAVALGSVPDANISPRANLTAYLRTGWQLMRSNVIMRYSTAMYFLSWTYQYLIFVSVTLAESQTQASSSVTSTRANFCGGAITFLFLQAFFLNIVYIIGSLGYGVLTERLSARFVFSYVLPLAGFALAGSTLVLLFRLHGIMSSIVLAWLSFVSYAFYLYCQNVGIATMSESLTGFYSSFIGVIGAVLLLLPAAFTALAVRKAISVLLCAALMAAMAALSARFASVAADELTALETAANASAATAACDGELAVVGSGGKRADVDETGDDCVREATVTLPGDADT